MSTLQVAQAPAAAEVGRRFYLVMALIMAAVIVAGFSQTVPGDFTPPGVPLLYHVHGAIFTAWVVLFVAQPSLVVAGDVRRHMQLGILGAVLAALMVVMGLAATIFAYSYHRVPSFFPPSIFLVMNCLGILLFGALVATAIMRRGEPEWHKRLMLCAMGSILGPGLGRFLPMDAFGAAAPLVMIGVNDAILLAGPAADLLVRRRVHPAYYWGIGSILVYEVSIGPIAFSPPAMAIVRLLRGH